MISKLIKRRHGSVATWEQEFPRTGMSLGGGSGWVILNYSYRDNVVHNYWAADRTNSLAWGVPLLVMDMYEHAYAMDYGADAAGISMLFFKTTTGMRSIAALKWCGALDRCYPLTTRTAEVGRLFKPGIKKIVESVIYSS
jgi:hypothetical protein